MRDLNRLPPALGPRLLALAAALLAALIWGGWFPLARLAMGEGELTPGDIAFIRFAVPALVLAPVAWRHGLRPPRGGWTVAWLMALAGGTPYAYFIALGLADAPAAHAAIFVPGVFPATTFVLAVLALGEPTDRRRFVGLGLVVLGVGLVGLPVLFGVAGGEASAYLLFAACAVMMAIYSVLARQSEIGPFAAIASIAWLSLIAFVPGWLVFGDSALARLSFGQLAFHVAYQGFGVGLVALVAYTAAVRTLGAGPAALFGGLVPCLAAALAVPILGEQLSALEIAGIVAVSAGIVAVSLERRGTRATPVSVS